VTSPVLMIHGMCCTGDVWHNFRGFFEARGHAVFTPTLRPDARVREPEVGVLGGLGLYDYLKQLEDEIHAIEQRTGQQPVVIGHSMGGLLAQLIAERNLARAAVFISPTSPVGARSRFDRAFWRGVRLFGALGLHPRVIRPGGPFVNDVVLNAADEPARARALAGFVAESGRAFRDFATCAIDEQQIRIPVLTVSAKRDRLVPARMVRLTAAKYQPIGGAFLEYGAHGHWLYDEPGWEKPASDIHDWLTTR
jgi:pimeloyl-ACP methyl ester carboxylesterase